MLNIPKQFNLNTVKTFISSFILPNKIDKAEDIDELAEDIKKLKNLQTNAKAERKDAEEPFESARKKADKDLKVARDGKKSAGEPFKDVIDWAASTEQGLRTLIVNFQQEQQRLKQQEEARLAQLAQEAEQKKQEAEAAKIAARKTGDNKDLQQAHQAEQEALSADNELAVAEDNVSAFSSSFSLNTNKAKVLDFEITDITQVPDEYVAYVPDEEAIENEIRTKFPYLRELKFELDEMKVPDELMKDLPLPKLILKALQEDKDLVIPGVKRTHKERLVVR